MFSKSETSPSKTQEDKDASSLRGSCRNLFVAFITDITCNITTDADLYSSRVTPRGLFTENGDRHLQKNVLVGPRQTCSEFPILIQVGSPPPSPWGLVSGEHGGARGRSPRERTLSFPEDRRLSPWRSLWSRPLASEGPGRLFGVAVNGAKYETLRDAGTESFRERNVDRFPGERALLCEELERTASCAFRGRLSPRREGW